MTSGTNILAYKDTETLDSQKLSSTSTTRAHAREELEFAEQQLEKLMLYAADAGLPDTPAMRAYNRRLLLDDYDHRILFAALDETLLAPRPSWRYYAAIMRNIMAREIKFYYQWLDRQRTFRELHRD